MDSEKKHLINVKFTATQLCVVSELLDNVISSMELDKERENYNGGILLRLDPSEMAALKKISRKI